MIDVHGSVGLRRWCVGNVAVERALMPYFQRAPLNDRTSPSAAGPGPEVASGVAASIVERAGAILDRETASQQPTASGVAGVARAREGGLPSIADIPGLAELQTRASEVFAAFLEGFSRPASLATPGAAAPAPATVPLITSQAAARAGEAATVAVKLVNDRAAAANLILYSTDFVSDTGAQIPASQVTFAPRTLVLEGRAHAHAQMKISIPAQSVPGLYSALVQAMGLGRPSAVVVLRVE
jgi:hypothetical protein